MLTKETKIQFILSEGASAKLDGLNLCRGLKKLGYKTNYWFHVPPNQKIFEEHFSSIYKEKWEDLRGNLFTNPLQYARKYLNARFIK